MSSYYIPLFLSNRTGEEWAISPRRSFDIIDPRVHSKKNTWTTLDDVNLPPILFTSQDGVWHDHPDDNASEDSSRKSGSGSDGTGRVVKRKLMPVDLLQKNFSSAKQSMEEKKKSALWNSSAKNSKSHALPFQPAPRVARANGV